jgi:branched-chain amino acid transport system substrate-binding protein
MPLEEEGVMSNYLSMWNTTTAVAKRGGICAMVLVILLSACSSRDDKQKRAYRAARGKGDILVGAVAPWESIKDKGMYWQGLEMALNEVNESGGALGRRIRIVREDDEGKVSKGRIVAQKFADNLDMVAVIGHYNSYISIPTSVVYEYYGLLMLSPTSTSPALTRRQGFKLVFRNIPTDAEVARQLADFATLQEGYRRLMIYYVKDAYGRGLANAFEKRAEEGGGYVVDRLSYDSTSDERYFRKNLTFWKNNFTFDAIFLAGVVPQAAEFISEARRLGITVPILGGDGLDSPQLWEVGGIGVEGTIVGTYFHPDDPRGVVQRFVEAFGTKYGRRPDAWAAQGYDAVKLLAHVMEEAGTTVPHKMAETLRSTRNWPGVTGPHSFNENGDVMGKPIVIKVVRNRSFHLH